MIVTLSLKRHYLIGLTCAALPFSALAEAPAVPEKPAVHPSISYQENVDRSFEAMLKDNRSHDTPQASSDSPRAPHPAELLQAEAASGKSRPGE